MRHHIKTTLLMVKNIRAPLSMRCAGSSQAEENLEAIREASVVPRCGSPVGAHGGCGSPWVDARMWLATGAPHTLQERPNHILNYPQHVTVS